MRTKVLALAAAVAFIGAATSNAAVYSQNAVGYYNLTLYNGFNLIANQLINETNTLNNVLPTGLPDGSTVQIWDAGSQSFTIIATYLTGYGWYDPDSPTAELSTIPMNPGSAFFLNNIGATVEVTVVGEVPQADETAGEDPLSQDLLPNFNLISQLTPQKLQLNAPAIPGAPGYGEPDSGFPAGDGDTLQRWDPVGQTFSTFVIASYLSGYGWYDPESPTADLVDTAYEIGEGFFYARVGSATPWTRYFSVNE